MISFFRKYPHKFFLQTAFRRLSQAKVVFSLQDNRIRMLIKGEKSSTSIFVPEVQNQPGAPLIGSASRAVDFRQVLANHKISIGGKFVFLVNSEVEMRLLSTQSFDGIDTTERLRKKAPSELFPTFDRHNHYEWEYLTPELNRLNGELPSAVLFAGIPTKVRRWIEGWTEQVGGEVVAIVPSVVASIRWCLERAEQNALLLLGSKESQLAVIQDGKLMLLERHPDLATIAKDPGIIAGKIRNLEKEIGELKLSIFRGDASMMAARQIRDDLEPLISSVTTHLLEPSPEETKRIKASESPVMEAYVMESLIR